ncbi:hypothetical protein [Bradyrhizobium sp.]|uniref:hypothetical protein n=1 Tax=Bradyrhizobium sp. TaxID=376 RepID=UPI00239524F1|nr:hypothetical protein [Bradyrhizobium sp.]MDE2379714.1 hypothetical protein [Bradyrhizobium sp.]
MAISIGQAAAAFIGLVILWTLIRAWRTGVIYTRGYSFDLEENPMLFTLASVVHGLGFAFCCYVAAGYPPADFLRLIVAD